MLHQHFNNEFGLLLKLHRTVSQEKARDITGIRICAKEKGEGGMTLYNFIAICSCMKWGDAVFIAIIKHLIKVYEAGMEKQNGMRMKRKKKAKPPNPNKLRA
jgi:hypothetical protein